MKTPWPPLRRVLSKILRDHEVAGTLSVVFVGDAEISRLHAEFFDDDTPTDVISFPLAVSETSDASRLALHQEPVGEVVVSVETAAREARRRGVAVAEEAALYAIHGTLHIVGYDDVDTPTRRLMRARERQYMSLLQFTSDRAEGGR